jgi:hypothetical protein
MNLSNGIVDDRIVELKILELIKNEFNDRGRSADYSGEKESDFIDEPIKIYDRFVDGKNITIIDVYLNSLVSSCFKGEKIIDLIPIKSPSYDDARVNVYYKSIVYGNYLKVDTYSKKKFKKFIQNLKKWEPKLHSNIVSCMCNLLIKVEDPSEFGYGSDKYGKYLEDSIELLKLTKLELKRMLLYPLMGYFTEVVIPRFVIEDDVDELMLQPFLLESIRDSLYEFAADIQEFCNAWEIVENLQDAND